MSVESQPWFLGSGIRRLRLASGVVLLTYVTTHLANHAVCNVSFAAADRLLLAQKWIWQGIIGSAALYAALLIHMCLGLFALYTRRHLRWNRAEAFQLVLGLAIPPLLVNHLAVTRAAWTLFGLNKGYVAELASLWIASPALGLVQIAVLIAAWTHACLGLFFLLRLRFWFPRWAPVLLSAAILLPVLAILGFMQGGREVARALADSAFRRAQLGPAVSGSATQIAYLTMLRNEILLGYAGAVAMVFVARGLRRARELRHGLITISYGGAGTVRVAPGHTVLDASRLGNIPHASVCGGRGRCSTCRIRILRSAAPLPAPSAHERALLLRIGAGSAATRLACQLRPRANLDVVALIPPAIALQFVAGRVVLTPEEEVFVAAMFIDLRGSTALMERCTPFDSVFLLGRFIDSVSRAVTACGGRPVQFMGDGVLALFGPGGAPDKGCRDAIRAVNAIGVAAGDLSALFEQESGEKLRFGIGLHCGMAVIGEIGIAGRVAFTALGDTINLAHRLQEMARDLGAMAAISEAVFMTAGHRSLWYRGAHRDAARQRTGDGDPYHGRHAGFA